MVERHLRVAARLGELVDSAPDLELLAPVRSCVVCLRYRPAGVPEADLDAVNARLGRALLEDGRVYAGTTVYRGMTALRPAIVNWRTTDDEIDLLLAVVRELGRQHSESATTQ
jgi:glutamate/tyrosine decarboxylase-like PLP-dependent enzyme